jgi:hypothetical protein
MGELSAGEAGLERLEELIATPPRVRMPCLLNYGVSGAGKSMLLEKFQRDHAQTCQRRSGRRAIVPPRCLRCRSFGACTANSSGLWMALDNVHNVIKQCPHMALRKLRKNKLRSFARILKLSKRVVGQNIS